MVRQSKPRSFRQFCSAHCPSLNIMCSMPSRDRQPFERLVRWRIVAKAASSALVLLILSRIQCMHCRTMHRAAPGQTGLLPVCRLSSAPWECARSQARYLFERVAPGDDRCARQPRGLHLCATQKIAPYSLPVRPRLLMRSMPALPSSAIPSRRPSSRLDHCRQAMPASPRGRKINNVSRFHGGVSPSAGLLSSNNNSTRYAANLQTAQTPDSVITPIPTPDLVVAHVKARL